MQTLAKFGVDTKVISDLNTDLLRQYISVSQQLMKTWMGRIHEADIKADAEVYPLLSLSLSLSPPSLFSHSHSLSLSLPLTHC
jgi:hypothetical protein